MSPGRKKVLDISHIGDGLQITDGVVIPFYTHTHMYYEMLIYESFIGHISINGEDFTMDSETLVVIAPSAFHSTHVDQNKCAHYLKLSFSEEMLDETLKSRLTESIILRKYRSNQLITLLVERLRVCRECLAENRILLNALLLELCGCSDTVVHGNTSKTAALVIEAERMISRCFCEDITIEAIAKEIHVSVPHLSKSFKKHMGIGISEYLYTMRLRYAYSLLAQGELDVTEVCYACGFRNLSHFIRSFKRQYGITPGKKRRDNAT